MSDPWSQERGIDKFSLLVGVAAVVGAALVLLDRSGWVRVDELVVLVSFWTVLGGIALIRSVLRLRHGRGDRGAEEVSGA